MSTPRRFLGLGSCVAFSLYLAPLGCVSSHAGYQRAEHEIAERTGMRVPRSHEAEDAESAKAARDLLARPVTADGAARVALLVSPEVKAALARIGVARGALVEALHVPNPKLEGALRFRKNESPDISLGATINLTDLIFMPLGANAASSELDAASLEAAGLVMDVVFEARSAFYDLAAAETDLGLARSELDGADAAKELAVALAKAGNLPRLDELDQRAVFEESRVAFAEAESKEMVARERLNAAMGLWGAAGAAWKIDPTFREPGDDVVSVADAERKAVSRSIDIAVAQKRYAAAADSANAARAKGLVPELDVGVDAERDPDGWGVGPKVAIGVPLFYQGQGAVDSQRAQMSHEERLQEALAIQVRSEARALVARVEHARDATRFYDGTLLPLRKAIVDEATLHANAMSTSAFQVIAARRAELMAKRDRAAALHEYWSARSALELLLAGRLTRPLAHDFGLGVRGSVTSD